MTTQLPLKTDYQAVRAQLEGAISQKLAMVEDETLAKLPKEVADDMRGGYVRDVAGLVSLFTPDYYAGCVDAFDGDTAEHAFLDFCIQEMNENLAYLALCAWPNAIGREHAWSALSFPLEQQWADKVSIIEEDQPMAETAPTVPTPMTLEYLVEIFSNQYSKEQVEGFVESLGLEGCGQMAEAHAELRYNGIEFSELEEQFGCAFTQEEAEAVVAGFGGDVSRASKLYRELTEDYVSTMTVEALIEAGKG